jgi:uncharacterized protein (DUF488 family)
VETVYTIGFAKKTAAQFFGTLRQAGIRRVLDVRLNNTSQLAGFTKRADLEFFLKALCDADYVHEPRLAPTKPLLQAYKKSKGDWSEYERGFLQLMADRGVEGQIDPEWFAIPTALLCSEPTAERCHRRLVLEYLRSKWGDFPIVHL